MALSKDEVIELAKGFLDQARKKHDVQQAYLFGSFAKGTAKEYSDIDIAVILGSIHGTEASPFDESFEIFHEAQEFSSLLEVICFDQEEFDRDGGSLAHMIKKEGVRLV
jgi:predicted nucleotidyltransferase